eukprot:g9049.t1
MAWWLQLGEEGDWSEAECPLAAFVGTGASIALGVSEDIESLMLMGLMRMGGVGLGLRVACPHLEFLLTATVELGRACEAWASGGRNAEAPRTHLHKAINALMKGAKAQSTQPLFLFAFIPAQPWSRFFLSPPRAMWCWGLFAIWASSLLFGAAVKAPVACGRSENVTVDLVRLSPQQPHTNEKLTVEVLGRLSKDALIQDSLDPAEIGIDARVLFCRRINDCMPVFHFNTTLCDALVTSGQECAVKPGETFTLSKTWHLPLLMVRGTYTLLLQFHRVGQAHVDDKPYVYYSNVINSQFYRPAGDVMSCYTMHEEVLASRQINILRDFRDAIIAFLIAASSSGAIGSHFPVWSRGILPQISGFLFIGILVGPYCANLVSQMHITIIGGMINKISLAFIAGARPF